MMLHPSVIISFLFSNSTRII